jgi:hypothetical protein
LVSSQEKDIIELKKQVDKLIQNNNTMKSADKDTGNLEKSITINENILYQNIPNSFSESTEIYYYLTDKVKNSTIIVYDMNGRQIKSYKLSQKGYNKISINGNEFNSGKGVYIYTLITDGQVIDTKRMIFTD